MKIENIKPIPKKIVRQIKKLSLIENPFLIGNTRFYSYFDTNDNDLVEVTVAVKVVNHTTYMQQVCCKCVESYPHTRKGKNLGYVLIKNLYCGYLRGVCIDWWHIIPNTEPANSWYGSYNSYSDNGLWYETKAAQWNMYSGRCLNPSYLNKFPEFKYCSLKNLPENYPYTFEYLRLYRKNPQIEMVVKAGFFDYIFDSKFVSLLKDKDFVKFALKHKEDFQKVSVSPDIYLLMYEDNINMDTAIVISNWYNGLWRNKDLIKNHFSSLKTAYYYLVKQNDIQADMYYDYISACEYLVNNNRITREAIDYMPSNLLEAHNCRIEQRHCVEKELQLEKLKERNKQFAEASLLYAGLGFVGDKYSIIVPQTIEDLINEGDSMDNCVGRMGYDIKVAEGKSLILFLRQTEDIKKSFVTIEYSLISHQILQCYAFRNSKPSDEVKNFVSNILKPYINKKLKEIKNLKEAI
jgi:hypothetical protein